jgi:hypothetical protein
MDFWMERHSLANSAAAGSDAVYCTVTCQSTCGQKIYNTMRSKRMSVDCSKS